MFAERPEEIQTFTLGQIQRYQRQMIMPEVGPLGQRKLLASKVLVIGAGGLGSPVALYLTSARVGTLGIIDFDTVDISNLHRRLDCILCGENPKVTELIDYKNFCGES